MGTVLVVTIAVAVGVLVYRLTAGGEEVPAVPEDDVGTWAGGESGSPETVRPSERSIEVPEGYIRVSGSGPSWHARLGGAMGLVIAVAVGAIALALSLWALGALLARLFAQAGAGGSGA